MKKTKGFTFVEIVILLVICVLLAAMAIHSVSRVRRGESLLSPYRESKEQSDPVRHLYVISSATGQCIIYSTVRGKIRSYSSPPITCWLDGKGVHHEHYVSGGQIIHISEKPLLAVKDVFINMETPPTQVEKNN